MACAAPLTVLPSHPIISFPSDHQSPIYTLAGTHRRRHALAPKVATGCQHIYTSQAPLRAETRFSEYACTPARVQSCLVQRILWKYARDPKERRGTQHVCNVFMHMKQQKMPHPPAIPLPTGFFCTGADGMQACDSLARLPS